MLESVSIRPSHAARSVREREPGALGPPAAGTAGPAPHDRVTISDEARAQGEGAKKQGGKDGARGAAGQRELTPDQQREVTWLQQRDRHVRQHEAAHQAAGGALAGGASFTYQTGPDGKNYAVGGEVPISLRTGKTPEETISNARQARRAALAPSDPSPADLAVAAEATRIEQAALRSKAQRAAKAYGGGEPETGASGPGPQASGARADGEEEAAPGGAEFPPRSAMSSPAAGP